MAHMSRRIVYEPRPPMTKCTHTTLKAVTFDKSTAFICDMCFEMGYKSGYQCSNNCDYQIHEDCLNATNLAHHPFFEQSFTLQSQESPNTNCLCLACGMTVKGLRYFYNYQHGAIFIHPCCMKMPHSSGTNAGQVLFLKRKLLTVKCKYCESFTLGGRVHGWAYVSADEKLAYHVKCIKEMKNQEWNDHSRSHHGRPEFDVGSTPSSRVGSSRLRKQIHDVVEEVCGNAIEEVCVSTIENQCYTMGPDQYSPTVDGQYYSTVPDQYYSPEEGQYYSTVPDQYYPPEEGQYYSTDPQSYCGTGEESYCDTGEESYCDTGEEPYCDAGPDQYYTGPEEYCGGGDEGQTLVEVTDAAASLLTNLDVGSLIGGFNDLFFSDE